MIDLESLTSLVDKDVLKCLLVSSKLVAIVVAHHKPENCPLRLSTHFYFFITLFVTILSHGYD